MGFGNRLEKLLGPTQRNIARAGSRVLIELNARLGAAQLKEPPSALIEGASVSAQIVVEATVLQPLAGFVTVTVYVPAALTGRFGPLAPPLHSMIRPESGTVLSCNVVEG